MKKIILSLVLISFLALPVLSSAYDVLPKGEAVVTKVLDQIVDVLFYFLLLLAAIFIIIAGITFVSSGGDPEKTKKARDMIMYAVIGLVVAFISKGIVTFIENFLKGQAK